MKRKGKLRRYLLILYNYLKGWCREVGLGFLPSHKIKKILELQQGRFRLDIVRKFFT